MKNKNLLYLLIGMLFCITSCQKLKYGNVVEKWYVPDRTYTRMSPIVHSNGKTSFTTYIPSTVHESEHWCIKVTGIGTKGDTITRTYRVNKIAYDTLTIGKFICIDGTCGEEINNK